MESTLPGALADEAEVDTTPYEEQIDDFDSSDSSESLEDFEEQEVQDAEGYSAASLDGAAQEEGTLQEEQEEEELEDEEEEEEDDAQAASPMEDSSDGSESPRTPTPLLRSPQASRNPSPMGALGRSPSPGPLAHSPEEAFWTQSSMDNSMGSSTSPRGWTPSSEAGLLLRGAMDESFECPQSPQPRSPLVSRSTSPAGSAGFRSPLMQPVQVSRSPSSVDEGLARSQSPGARTPVQLPQVWLTEPASIDEPLLLLDEAEAQERAANEMENLRAELAEARAAAKADRAALDALENNVEACERERDSLQSVRQQLEQENKVLRIQLENHHGIMAADWAQTLGFKEQLREEEAAHERLAGEVAELREAAVVAAEQVSLLRQDAQRWRLLSRPEKAAEVSTNELDEVAEVAMTAVPMLNAEARSRSRRVQVQLHSELEQQLCVVCRDAKKAVLFLPCLHVCVCERCRGRLRPYRCPICQEPVQGCIGRIHF